MVFGQLDALVGADADVAEVLLAVVAPAGGFGSFVTRRTCFCISNVVASDFETWRGQVAVFGLLLLLLL